MTPNRSAIGSLHMWLWVLAAVSLAAGLGMREPSPPDEPRFVLAAKHMVDSGEWLIPHRGREIYAEKPPTFMWMQALAYQIVGNWDFAFLLPSLFAGLATLWLTWDLARRLWGRRAALHAAAALWVCLQFGLMAKRGQIDMVLVFLTTLALWGLLRHLMRGPAWAAAWLGAFAAGLGTVTKGVGFLPLLVLLPWLIARHRIAPAQRASAGDAWRWVALSGAFVAGTMVWLAPLFFALATRDDPALAAYARELLFRQTGERYLNTWHHIQPFWYYAQVIATLWLPGALLLPWLLPAWWRRLRRRDPRQILLLGWCLIVLVFFSISPGKREVYVFPMLPALCIAAAPILPGLLRRRAVRSTLALYLAVFAGTAAVLSLAALSGASSWAQRLATQRTISEADLGVFLWSLLALGLAGLIALAWARLRRIATALVVFSGALWAAYGVGLAPALDATSSAHQLMQDAGSRIGPSAQLGLVAWREQNLLQADREVTEFGFRRAWHEQWQEASEWVRADPDQRWLLVLHEALSACVDARAVESVGLANRRHWLLVPGTALVRDCVTPPFAPNAPAPE